MSSVPFCVVEKSYMVWGTTYEGIISISRAGGRRPYYRTAHNIIANGGPDQTRRRVAEPPGRADAGDVHPTCRPRSGERRPVPASRAGDPATAGASARRHAAWLRSEAEDHPARVYPAAMLDLLRAILADNAALWPYKIEEVLDVLAAAPETRDDSRLSELRRRRSG